MDFHEAILYSDDSLCIRHTDGSVLQLSPCSSTFRFYQNSSFKLSHVQQFSRFAVSTNRKQVTTAISLRNQFACYPYLCKDLLNKDSIIVCYKGIKQCTWPRTALPDFVVNNSDGSILVKSLDGFASLVLSSHKKTFTVCYLAEVNPDSMKPQAAQKKQHFYTWVQKGQQSVDECEECWMYPLMMAFSVGNGVQTKSEELSKMTNVTELPDSLPITCPASHVHKWIPKEVFSGKENEDVFWQPNLKAVWKNEVLYRVYNSRKELLQIEIHPGDGSVIFSSNFTGRFFTHSTSISEDKMYSIDQPPPDKPGMKYSIAKLIRQGARLFEFMLQVGFHSNSLHVNRQSKQACWESKLKDVQDEPAATTPLQISETATIPSVGRFVAYSNGHLHVAFADRTMLNVRYPMVDPKSLLQQGILGRGLVFNMILPNGQAMQVNDQNMFGLERYIKLACEWGDWVYSSPQQRQSFYKDSIYNQDQKRIVESEIRKLRRFNYILNNGPLNRNLVNPNHNHSENNDCKVAWNEEGKEGLATAITHGMPSINNALKKTTDAIKDIETFLHSKTVKKTI